MAPRLSDRLLPPNQSPLAQNVRLISGELRGSRTPSLVHRFETGTVNRAYRAVSSAGDYVWIGLGSADASIVKGPLVNDGYERYYWIDGEDYIEYNSLDRIENGDPAYKLGVPAPTAAASLAISGGSGSIETRAYVYTFVNAWGEESAPSPVVLASGYVNGTWQLTGLPTAAVDPTGRNAATVKRIYRTVTGQATVSYFYVAEISLATATYDDTSANLDVASRVLLKSFSWAAPLEDLDGLVAHPNGFLVAFKGRNLYFSERYRPHAWPADYTLSTEDPIVALAVYNNMVTVLTRGKPYFAVGNLPSSISLQKSEAAEPCLSAGSVASTLQGVMYASPNGLVLFNESGPQVLSRQLLTIEEWSRYSPSTLRGAQYGTQYIGFYSPQDGVRFSPGEPFGVFSEIDNIGSVDNIVTDQTTGDCWIIRDNCVEQWEPPTGVPLFYRWKSKVFDFPKPVNFGALMVKLRNADPAVQVAFIDLIEAFNLERIAGPLNEINSCELNGVDTYDVGTTPAGIESIPNTHCPVGGSALYTIEAYEDSLTALTVLVYADGRLISVYNPLDSVMYRVPSGFKAHTWQFEFIGNADVYSFAIAETARELQTV